MGFGSGSSSAGMRSSGENPATPVGTAGKRSTDGSHWGASPARTVARERMRRLRRLPPAGQAVPNERHDDEWSRCLVRSFTPRKRLTPSAPLLAGSGNARSLAFFPDVRYWRPISNPPWRLHRNGFCRARRPIAMAMLSDLGRPTHYPTMPSRGLSHDHEGYSRPRVVTAAGTVQSATHM